MVLDLTEDDVVVVVVDEDERTVFMAAWVLRGLGE